jgi:hypothetical protein
MCHSCYTVWRYNNDPVFRVRQRLRALFNRAMKEYSIAGKIHPSKKYGTDYEKIITHLGECPGNLSEYQIDHVLPLSVFDLNNPIHIKAAFAPENHQWLLTKENHKKCARFDPCALQTYLAKWR